MRIGRTSEYFDLTLRGGLPRSAGGPEGLNVDADVRSGPFAGRKEAVWIALEVWRDFLEALTTLNASRRGSAYLSSIRPNELKLTIRSDSREGRVFMVEGELGDLKYVGDQPVVTKVTFGFEIDPAALPPMVTELQGWLEPA
jgi:hypothetical protein